MEDAYAAALNSLSPQYAQVGSIILRKNPAEDHECSDVTVGLEHSSSASLFNFRV